MQLKVELRRQCNAGNMALLAKQLKSVLKEELAASDEEADNAGDTNNVGDANNTTGETYLIVNDIAIATGDTANAAANYDVAEVDVKQAFQNLSESLDMHALILASLIPALFKFIAELNQAAVTGEPETEDREVEEVCDNQQEEMNQTLEMKL